MSAAAGLGGSRASFDAPEELRIIRAALEVLAQYHDDRERRRPVVLDALLGRFRDLTRLETTEVANVAPPVAEAHAAPMINALAWTKSEAAASVRVSQKTVERAIRAGELRPTRIGRSVRLRPEAVAAWVEQCESGSMSTEEE